MKETVTKAVFKENDLKTGLATVNNCKDNITKAKLRISASTKANGKEQDNRYWGCRKGKGKRKLP